VRIKQQLLRSGSKKLHRDGRAAADAPKHDPLIAALHLHGKIGGHLHELEKWKQQLQTVPIEDWWIYDDYLDVLTSIDGSIGMMIDKLTEQRANLMMVRLMSNQPIGKNDGRREPENADGGLRGDCETKGKGCRPGGSA
jgi:hypothetical protein